MRTLWSRRTGEATSARGSVPRSSTAVETKPESRPVHEVVDALVAEIGRGPEAVIPLLQAIQREFRHLPEQALRRVAETTEITPAALAGVSTFYSQFRHHPVGRHLISICHGTACHVKGAERVTEALYRHLRMEAQHHTDEAGLFTVQKVACLGCCTLAPVLQIDGVTYGHLTPEGVPQALADFLQLRRRSEATWQVKGSGQREADWAEIRIGVGSCCVAGGSLEVGEALEQAVRDLAAPAVVKPVGCVGICHQTPLVEVLLPGQEPAVYARVQAGDAEAIVRRHFRPRGVLRRARLAVSAGLDRLLTDESWEPVTRYALDVREAPVCSFLGPQRPLVTDSRGCLDPLDLDEYEAAGGFEALRRCLGSAARREVSVQPAGPAPAAQTSAPLPERGEAEADSPTFTGKEQGTNSLPVVEDAVQAGALGPEGVLEALVSSGLRGRGGAGFPTGVKFSLAHDAQDEIKYIICNGDEGDPGAFMDRMLLESYPYRVLEGMIISAYAVGAHEGFLYVRAEYRLAVQRLREAIRRCEERGLLGEDILGSGFDLRLRVWEGAGAFVCGEETALIASLEGRRGHPHLRPPYPAEEGLWGRPTAISNVETYASIPYIIRVGPEAFAAIGTAHSKGTKVFALAGKVARGGLIEVPMGVTLRQIVEEIGGGVAEGRRFKAVQIGGPSGGCLPAELSDTPVDYEALTSAGAIMGSGGLVVLDDRDCMVDIARYFLEFTQRESCGKCTFCRLGTHRMLEILERLCTGHGRPDDLHRLEDLARAVRGASLCGLGRTAPNPVLTTLRYFREEYEAHVQGRCPAKHCRALIGYRISDKCIGCTKCAQQCPAEAIALTPFERHVIDQQKCTRCDTCRTVCPVEAVEVE